MPENRKLNWLLNSGAYRRAKDKVRTLLNQPALMKDLASKATKLIGRENLGKLDELRESLSAAVRMVSSYAKGDYREISLETFGLILASVVYFVMPLDLVPDFILGLGFADDAALLAWTLRAVGEDLSRFIAWEQTQSEIREGEVLQHSLEAPSTHDQDGEGS